LLRERNVAEQAMARVRGLIWQWRLHICDPGFAGGNRWRQRPCN